LEWTSVLFDEFFGGNEKGGAWWLRLLALKNLCKADSFYCTKWGAGEVKRFGQ
jgi:hypothetical protein